MDYKIWKLSHGQNFFDDTFIEECKKRNVAIVYPDTNSKGQTSIGQGEAFIDTARQYDVFYLCHANKKVILIGFFYGLKAIDSKVKDEWSERTYKVLKEAIPNNGYHGKLARWWLPNDNSTFIEIKQKSFPEFEETILKPFFDLSIEQLTQLRNKYMPNARLEYYKNLLLTNKNIIFTGAPGTGKTYLAKKIAKDIAEDDSRINFVQFHPSYDYTDFVEGLRPYKEDGKDMGFKLKNGIFKEFCREAKKYLDKKYVFIIDEINRAEISKVFGELFYSIDPFYRGIDGKVTTQYKNIQNENTWFTDIKDDYFYVPENVYIIGTMNDIDRSVESFDFAMRRRFTWIEIKADDPDRLEMLNSLGDEIKEKAINKLKTLNNAIFSEEGGIEGLNRGYHIGPVYFLKLKMYANDFDKLWEMSLEPLLKEYIRGMPNAKDVLIELKKAYDGTNS